MNEKLSKSMKDYYNKLRESGDYDRRMESVSMMISNSMKGREFTEEHKQKLKDNHWTKEKGNEVTLEKVIDAGFKKGNDPWNKDLTKETDMRLHNSIASQPHSKEWNDKVGESLRKSEKHKRAVQSEEFKLKQRENRMKQRIPTSRTSIELRFMEIVKKYDLPYKFVGDGQFWLGYPPKNPDFLNVNGKKEVVEINGIYWHFTRRQKQIPELTRLDVENYEKKHFAKYHFDCKIIWEDELEKENLVLDKLGVLIL